MVSRVIQAVAGAGKTYHVANSFSNSMRCMYVTFTNENVNNIYTELIKGGRNLENCNVSTFSKFICDWFIRPFFPKLRPCLGSFKGFTTLNPPENTQNRNNGYVKDSYARHYVDETGRLYLSRISELVTKQKRELRELMFQRIGWFTDILIVDEYQDLTGKDFDLLKLLVKQKFFDVTLVGDVFQTGVSQSVQRKESKLLGFNQDVDTFDDFMKGIFGSKKLIIDNTSLIRSRRISPSCAEFVEEHLGIEIKSMGVTTTGVHRVTGVDELNLIMSNKMTVLIFSRNVTHDFPNEDYNSWSYVKGSTCGDVLVVLTTKTDKILESEELTGIPRKTLNKLYVALTRATGELYIVSSDIWKSANQIIK
nr:AAA family ATPase [Lactiplantibacillus plantarum]